MKKEERMDVLHFMKDEYSVIRDRSTGLVPGDLAVPLEGETLFHFMLQLDLVVRVGGELIIPELADAGRSASAAAMLAEDHTRSLGRMVAAFRKTGEIVESKRLDLFKKITSHLDHMEKVVLPLVRELIPTAVREDIGEIALDFKQDVRPSAGKPSKSLGQASISA
jgi:hypothetical protein